MPENTKTPELGFEPPISWQLEWSPRPLSHSDSCFQSVEICSFQTIKWCPYFNSWHQVTTVLLHCAIIRANFKSIMDFHAKNSFLLLIQLLSGQQFIQYWKYFLHQITRSFSEENFKPKRGVIIKYVVLIKNFKSIQLTVQKKIHSQQAFIQPLKSN